MGDDETGGIIVLLVFLCCVSVCVWFAWKKYGDSGDSGPFWSSSQMSAALANFHFPPPALPVPAQYRLGDDSSPYSFGKFTNFKAGDFAKIGTPVSGKSTDDCNALCGQTHNCVGFSTDNNQCTLYNNVNILERSQGSTVYASKDIGGVQYLKAPYKNIEFQLAPQLWTKTGQIGDVVANCIQSHDTCKGFSYEGGTAKMFPAILSVNSQQTGETYIDPNKPAMFIQEGNFKYSDTPATTWNLPSNWLLPVSGNQVQYPRNEAEAFTIWNSNWDAGNDMRSAALNASNTITVTDLTKCQNLCMSNSWCQSFVFDRNSKQCHMRNSLAPQHFPLVCHGTNYSTGPGASCTCGATTPGGLVCNGSDPAHDGTSDGAKDSYVKKQQPMQLACPQVCSQDGDCKMVTFNQSTCNQYTVAPTNRSSDSAFTSVWKFNNFPG